MSMTITTEQASMMTRWAEILRRTGLVLTGGASRAADSKGECDMTTMNSDFDTETDTDTETGAETEAEQERIESAADESHDDTSEADTGETEGADTEDGATEVVIVPVDLKKKELIDRAVLRSGMKKKDVKPVVEAILAELGEAIGEGRGLNLEPFGKLRINRSDERANGRVTVCRLRQNLNAPKGDEPPTDAPLAEAAE